MLDTLKPAPPMVLWSSFCTAGPTTFTALSMSLRCWRRQGTGLSCHICATFAPHLRGHGTTRFLSSGTFRNAQQSVVALDIIALMDALPIRTAILAGYDWGARTANIIAAL